MILGFIQKKFPFFRKFLSVGLIALFLVVVLMPFHVFATTTPTTITLSSDPLANIPNQTGQNNITVASQSAGTPLPPTAGNAMGIMGGWAVDGILTAVNLILFIIEGLIAGLLYLAGTLLDMLIAFSITDLAKHINDLTGINTAWKLIRDLCNMSFIFILLYNGIMTIFTSDNKAKKIIVPVIIAALLINFSLFFTKIIIDASNIVAVSFYNSILTGSGQAGGTTIAGNTVSSGISTAFMKAMNLSSLYSKDILSSTAGDAGAKTLMIIGGSFFMIIAAFVFIAIAILFFIRYIVFIFLLIISPLGYMASVIPGLQSTSKKYWDTLIGQALFAPIFMIMVWIDLTLMQTMVLNPGGATMVAGLGTALTNPSPAGTLVILNYFIVIGFLILTLIVSKDYATKGGIVSGKLVSAATGFAGGLAFGGAAAFSRNTLGRAAESRANNQDLKDRAAKGDKGAQLQLATARKLAGSSFDARRSGVGGAIAGAAGIDVGKGLPWNNKAGEKGYEQTIKDKKDKEKKYAESLEPNEEAKAKARAELASDEFKQKEEIERAKHVTETEAEHVANTNKAQAEKDAAKIQVDAAEAEKTIKGKEKKDVEDEIKQLEEDKKGVMSLSAQKVIQDEIDAKNILKKKAEEDLKIATETANEKVKIFKASEEKIVEIAKTREAEINSWHSTDYAKLSAITGGQKKEVYEKDHALAGQVKQKEILSQKEQNLEQYATALETKRTWNRAWMRTPTANKRAAVEVRRAKKSKSANDLIAEAVKKEAQDKAAAETPPTPPTTQTP